MAKVDVYRFHAHQLSCNCCICLLLGNSLVILKSQEDDIVFIANTAQVNARILQISGRYGMVWKIVQNFSYRSGRAQIYLNHPFLIFPLSEFCLLVSAVCRNFEAIPQLPRLMEIESNASQAISAISSHISIRIEHGHLVPALNFTDNQYPISPNRKLMPTQINDLRNDDLLLFLAEGIEVASLIAETKEFRLDYEEIITCALHFHKSS